MTLRTIPMLLAALALSMALVACGGEEETSDAPTAVTITAPDANGTVELAAGGVLDVVLESNPTTGYSWTVQEIDESVLVQEGEPEFMTHDESVVGSPGDQTTRFRAVAPGETPLLMYYHKAWEEGVEPVDTYEVTVVVE